jgi:hypothetical protein
MQKLFVWIQRWKEVSVSCSVVTQWQTEDQSLAEGGVST